LWKFCKLQEYLGTVCHKGAFSAKMQQYGILSQNLGKIYPDNFF